MMLPMWPEVREALTAAIRDALPLQVRKANGDRIAGVGLHIDAYYGSAGLYLLPESAARTLAPDAVDNLGDWPISTDWDGRDDHAEAFAAYWGRWDDWFHEHADGLTEDEVVAKGKALLRVACGAMRAVDLAGLLDIFPKTEGFKVIIVEYDESDDTGVERYGLFVRSGVIRCDGDIDRPSEPIPPQ